MKWLTTYRILREMTARLRWSPEDLCRYREQRLRDLVSHAYLKSPFYRRFYDQAGVRPDDVKSLDDLRKLPLLPKEMLRTADPRQVVTMPMGAGWMVEMTSGSTGEPLRVHRSWRDLYYIKAKVIRAFRQTGLRFTDRQVVLKSSAESLTGRHWFENLGVLRKYWLSVADAPEHNLERLRAIHPRHLHGFPSGLLAIAEVLNQRHDIFHIPTICTGAEVLEEVIRSRIEQAFKAQVYDFYACREIGNVAWECPAHDGLHINDDVILLELLDDQNREVPDGVEGRVVVTWLDGRDWPFLRYELGDRAVRLPGRCICGVPFGRLARVEGRSDSRILLPSGRWISGMVFQELRTAAWAAAFRFIQDDPHAIHVQIVIRHDPQPGELEAFLAKTRELVKGELQVIPEFLPQLERDASGKIRGVICRLPQARSSHPGETP